LEQQAPIEIRFPEEGAVPDLYADGVAVQGGPYGFSVIFTRSGNDPLAPTPVAVMRMSPQQTFVLARQLAKVVRIYEDQIGKINLPPAFLESLGIAEE
jgi:hypothetical protein